MAKATKRAAAKATKPTPKMPTPKMPATARKRAAVTVDPIMKPGFKAGDNVNRPIFLYINGGITERSAVTIYSVDFESTAGVSEPYVRVGSPTVKAGYIRLRVRAASLTAKSAPTVAPTSGKFSVSLSVDGGPRETTYLEAILYEY